MAHGVRKSLARHFAAPSSRQPTKVNSSCLSSKLETGSHTSSSRAMSGARARDRAYHPRPPLRRARRLPTGQELGSTSSVRVASLTRARSAAPRPGHPIGALSGQDVRPPGDSRIPLSVSYPSPAHLTTRTSLFFNRRRTPFALQKSKTVFQQNPSPRTYKVSGGSCKVNTGRGGFCCSTCLCRRGGGDWD